MPKKTRKSTRLLSEQITKNKLFTKQCVRQLGKRHYNLNKLSQKRIVQKKGACQVRKCDKCSDKYRILNKPVDLFKIIEQNIEQKKRRFFL